MNFEKQKWYSIIENEEEIANIISRIRLENNSKK